MLFIDGNDTWGVNVETQGRQLPFFPWNLRKAKSSQLVLKNASKLREVLKIMDIIHDMKCLFKTGFYKIIPHVGCIGPNVMKSGTPAFR